MKYFALLLAIVAGVVWYSRIQKDLATWRTSVEILATANQGAQGIPSEPENVANLITLLEHKPCRVALTAEEKELLAQAKGETPAHAPAPARPEATLRPTATSPAALPPLHRTPTPQEVAEEIARKYNSKR